MMILGFWTFAQKENNLKEGDLPKTENLDLLFGKLYDFSDSLLYVHRLDTFQSINNQIVSDSVRYFYQVLHDYCKAQLEIEKKHYFKAEPLLEQNIAAIDPTYKINSLNIFYNLSYQWLGEIKKSQGKYQESIAAFQHSIIYEDGPAYSIASTEKLIGETFALQDDWRNALLYYRKSLQRLKAYYPKAKMPQDRIETEKRLIRAYEAIATYYRVHQNLDSAQYYLDLRRPLLRINTESNMIDSYLLDGLMCSETGNYEAAMTFYGKALRLAKSQNDFIKIAEIYRNRAEIYLKKGMYRVSIIDADSALLSLAQKSNIVYKKDYLQAFSVKTDALISTYKSEKKTDLTQLNSIFSLLQKSTQLIDSVSVGFQNLRDKQTLLGLRRNTFRHGIWAATQLFEYTKDNLFLEKAFHFSEQSRSATLRSISQLDKVRNFAGVPDSINRKEEALRQKIAALENTIRLNNSIGESEHTLYDLQQQKREHRLILKQIEEQYPSYFALKYQHQPSNINQIKTQLKPSQNVLEFFVSGDEVYGFLISNKGLMYKKLDLTEEVVNSQVAEILNFTKGEEEDLAVFQKTAYYLYQKLIAPFEIDLSEEIIVIPDGNLVRLPFEVLLTEAVETQRSVAKLPYWIKKHCLSYHYAASLLFDEKNAWFKGSDWVVFAPDFQDEPDFQDKNTLSFFEKNIKKENVFKGNQATKANFQEKMKSCHVLHINTHGVANDSIGDLSYLRLSDANFYSAELYANKIKADLVTLSACQTANGELRYGEGAVGLTLGFLYAGAKSVVSSLWNVNQQSTGAFMQQFYERLLNEKQPNNKALRAAKLAIIEDNPNLAHPKYWAAFVLIGVPDAVVEKQNNWIWLIAIGGFILMLFIYWKIRRK